MSEAELAARMYMEGVLQGVASVLRIARATLDDVGEDERRLVEPGVQAVLDGGALILAEIDLNRDEAEAEYANVLRRQL